MAVYEYNEHDHPGQYQGLRVARRVGGEYRQRYFPFRHPDGRYLSLAEERALRAEAEALDRQWAVELVEARERQIADARPTARAIHATGVRGISAVFLNDRKHRAGRYITYYTPAFRVHGSEGGRRFYRAFRIPTLGYAGAWAEAVRFYAKAKGLKRWAHLRRRQPDPLVFVRVRAHMMAHGHAIPLEKLPDA